MKYASLQNEKELLSHLTNGSEQAFENLYYFYSKRLYGKFLKFVKCSALAGELLQNVWIKVWTNRSSINSEKSFRAYLFRIAENELYSHYRTLAKNNKIQEQLTELNRQEHNEIKDDLKYTEQVSKLLQAIELLPPQRKKIYKLCKLENKSYKEVGIQLSISPFTISDHIVKANQFIRQYLSQ